MYIGNQKHVLFFIVFVSLTLSVLAQSKVGNEFGMAAGAHLLPSKRYWEDIDRTRPYPVRILRLSQNRRLAVAGDTLYMLDHHSRIVWTWSAEGPPLDAPIIDASGTIYVIGADLLWAAIDFTTGKEEWRGTANGSAEYSQITLYRKDKYLVKVNMENYRLKHSDPKIKDKLMLCRGNDILWETEIPAKVHIKVQGRRVYALIRRKNRISVTRL